MTDHQDDYADRLGQLQFDAFGRLVDLDEMEVERYSAPPPVRWVPVDDLPYVQGMRVAINSRKGPVYDLRAATEVFDDGSGRFVNVVEEWRFFSWHHMPPAERPPLVPRATCLPTRLVWAEVYDK